MDSSEKLNADYAVFLRKIEETAQASMQKVNAELSALKDSAQNPQPTA
jgi:hypothetical protein